MLPRQDHAAVGSEDRKASQPPSKNPQKSFLTKMAITTRLLGKEIHRKKLKWFDLRRADYRLGSKAYEIQSSMSDQNQTIDRINKIQNQIEALGDPESSGPPSQQKFKAVAKGAGRFMKIQILRFRRNQLFRKLGQRLRQSPTIGGPLTAEAEQSRSASEKIDVVTSDIRTLAAATYVWARKPLLASSLALVLLLAFAAVAYEQGAAPGFSNNRSETSLAIERYLRTRYQGGGTDAEIIALSDAMAARFDAASLSPDERESCMDRNGAPKLLLWTLHAKHPDADKPVMKDLVAEMNDCIPPRLCFDELFERPRQHEFVDKPLPTDKHAGLTPPSKAGMLASEHLVALEKAIYYIFDYNGHAGGNPAGSWDSVKQFGSAKVLECVYRGEKVGSRIGTTYFWYERMPSGLEQALKTLPPDHAIRQIGPPLTAGPVDFELATKLNTGPAEAIERTAAEQAVPSLPQTGIGFIDNMAKQARDLDIAHLNDSKSVVAASGGRKMLCPKCGGSKKMVRHDSNSNWNPNRSGTLAHSLFENNRNTVTVVDCDKCGGTGVVDK
jgi:hypothetical protein